MEGAGLERGSSAVECWTLNGGSPGWSVVARQ